MSHRYKSPKVNLYFFDIFSAVGEVQFEVDEGTTPISVTRLARMVRDADAYIGIYPIPAAPGESIRSDLLESASQYFRLELALRARAGTPAIVFYDERYRAFLNLPPDVYSQSYDAQEIESPGGTPSRRRHKRVFEEFAHVVMSGLSFRDELDKKSARTGAVGVLLPSGDSGYAEDTIDNVCRTVDSYGYSAIRLSWPPSIGPGFISKSRSFDWVIIDTGDQPAGGVALGWLDGRGIPMLRLRFQPPGGSAVSDAEVALYGEFNVGYPEDRIVWSTTEQLLSKFYQAIDLIHSPVRRISTSVEAEKYFLGAQQRKESVFLSYASEDRWAAERLVRELRKRFQSVFDYRDGKSLLEGAGYPHQLYGRLRQAQVGIPLLSQAYVNKPTCMHEAEDMCVGADSGEMLVYQIVLDDVKVPDFFRSIQFAKFGQASDEVALVTRVVDICANRESYAEEGRPGTI